MELRRVLFRSADDCDGARAGRVVVGWLDGAAESGLNAKLPVEVSGDEFAGDGAGVTVDGSGEAIEIAEISEGEEVFEHRLGKGLLTQELVDRGGDGGSYLAA